MAIAVFNVIFLYTDMLHFSVGHLSNTTLKGKNLLPTCPGVGGGGKFFPFRLDHFFQKGDKTIYTVAFLECVSIPLK